MVRKSALQQALVLELKVTQKLASKLCCVSTGTIWMSIHAYNGSGRRAWRLRSDSEKNAAIAMAKELLKEYHHEV